MVSGDGQSCGLGEPIAGEQHVLGEWAEFLTASLRSCAWVSRPAVTSAE